MVTSKVERRPLCLFGRRDAEAIDKAGGGRRKLRGLKVARKNLNPKRRAVKSQAES